MKNALLLLAALAPAALLCIGCGAPEAAEATLEQNVYAQIEGLGDSAGDDGRFANAFVDGSVPENRDDYAQRGYQIDGQAKIDGDTATVPVAIFGGVYVSSESDRASRKSSSSGETTQTWKLQRVGEEWKIQDAPLG